MKRVSLFLSALVLLLVGAACGGPKKGRCDVQIYSPDKHYTQAVLLDLKGTVIDSTLNVVNDSIIFSRTDTAAMPYVATLRLMNPNDTMNMVYMPLVIEGGVVKMELGDKVSLSGTSDNDALYRFLKAKNTFMTKYQRDKKEDLDIETFKKDHSKFFGDQILLNNGTVVGDYLMQIYGQFLTPEDYLRVKERMKK